MARGARERFGDQPDQPDQPGGIEQMTPGLEDIRGPDWRMVCVINTSRNATAWTRGGG
jgi:hypothetical protein